MIMATFVDALGRAVSRGSGSTAWKNAGVGSSVHDW